MTALFEGVPNFSEGRDPAFPGDLARILEDHGALVLDHGSDPDHHRSVVTFVAEEEAFLAAGLAVARAAGERIDLGDHAGVHPRLGATDVFPVVPLEGASEAEAVSLAHRLGDTLARELALPIYFYGAAARTPERRELPDVRRLGRAAAGLGDLSGDARLRPDAGPARFHPTAGATVVGVRPPLVAFNVDLDSGDLDLARRIARTVRASSGGLPGVRALGFALEEAGRVQVSMNLLDPARTGLRRVFDAIHDLAAQEGVAVHRSELIGLAPRAALDGAIAEAVLLADFDPGHHVLEDRIAARLAENTP